MSNIKVFRLNEDSIYDNGFKLGLLCKDKLNYDFYFKIKEKLYQKISEKHNNIIFNLIKNKIKLWVGLLKSKYKIAIEDILGFSDALEIENDLILEVSVITEIYDYMCTLLGVKSGSNLWNLRILDLDSEFIDIVSKHNLPLSIIIYENINFISFNYLGFFKCHTSFFNGTMISTFSWNKLELKNYLKNEIPPIFQVRYSILNSCNIYEYLKNQNIIYDGYVMLMNKDKIILHDFNKIRNESKITDNNHIVISDHSFDIDYNINDFIRNQFINIPTNNRCFSVFYNFINKEFMVNNFLSIQKGQDYFTKFIF